MLMLHTNFSLCYGRTSTFLPHIHRGRVETVCATSGEYRLDLYDVSSSLNVLHILGFVCLHKSCDFTADIFVKTN